MTSGSTPQRLPGYRFTGRIGEGGMAAVYRGEQLSLGRPVAIKVLNRQMREHSLVAAAFDRESVIIARLNHPNIIQVFDRGVTDQGIPWFVMEYINGLELGAVVKKGILKLPQKYSIAVQICKALSYAHRNGVIHRDIKPGNVLVDKEGHVKVLDFGIAQFYDDDDHSMGSGERKDVMGTWAYMAPELQDASEEASVATDIYSLGLLLFELFCGHLPSGGITPKSFDQSLPLALVKVIIACVNQDPLKRPPSVNDVRGALLMISQGGHLSKAARQRAAGVMSERQKKSFSLLDVVRETEGFGAVYLFQEKNTGQQVVVKKLLGNIAGFEENQRLSEIEHSGIAKVHGVSRNERLFIVVSEYLAGGSLQERLIRPMEQGHFVDIAEQVVSALAFAHRQGIIHGNLRPSNILFSADGRVKLVDFGLEEHYASVSANWYRLQDETVGISADLYALGVIFYQMLTGELPHWEEGKLKVHKAFKKLSVPLQKLVAKLLLRVPEKRYLRADDVALDLAQLQDTVETAVFTTFAEEEQEETQVFKKVRKSISHLRRRKRLLVLVFLLLLAGNTLAWSLFLR